MPGTDLATGCGACADSAAGYISASVGRFDPGFSLPIFRWLVGWGVSDSECYWSLVGWRVFLAGSFLPSGFGMARHGIGWMDTWV